MATTTAPPDRTTPEYRWALAERIAGHMLEAGLSHRDVSDATTPEDFVQMGTLPKADAAYVRSLEIVSEAEARELFVRHARGKAAKTDPECCATFNFFRQLVWVNLYSRPDEEDGLPA
ncbi:hypothetical protein D3Y59_07420 [Hymenobacter oligotrophus]|uniref:Uncharacterized protein n=1 Tax=Hymenobacter oligotrophus TaxID=2319843 RepID=A0A3B7R6X3_9BACT|nr:hypothetical protein [Hymenobacter oligotrophus]AYA36899.1 hypothetical protein D3Y59_07420 [Hymenobacter oligotrophus]